jgi:hypothetical protein
MSIVVRQHPLGFWRICLHFFSGFFRLACGGLSGLHGSILSGYLAVVAGWRIKRQEVYVIDPPIFGERTIAHLAAAQAGGRKGGAS